MLTPAGGQNWTSDYLAFKQDEDVSKRKTLVWNVSTKAADVPLGTVKWFARWRRYCYFPDFHVVLEKDCLRDLAQFVEDRTREYTKGRSALNAAVRANRKRDAKTQA